MCYSRKGWWCSGCQVSDSDSRSLQDWPETIDHDTNCSLIVDKISTLYWNKVTCLSHWLNAQHCLWIIHQFKGQLWSCILLSKLKWPDISDNTRTRCIQPLLISSQRLPQRRTKRETIQLWRLCLCAQFCMRRDVASWPFCLLALAAWQSCPLLHTWYW